MQALGDMLFVSHNLEAGALIDADKRGGLAMPSIGITNVKTGFSQFGSIQLIGNSKMVDKPYRGDAYTTRAPYITKNCNKSRRCLYKQIKSKSKV